LAAYYEHQTSFKIEQVDHTINSK